MAMLFRILLPKLRPGQGGKEREGGVEGKEGEKAGRGGREREREREREKEEGRKGNREDERAHPPPQTAHPPPLGEGIVRLHMLSTTCWRYRVMSILGNS